MARSDPGGFWLLLIGLMVLVPSIWLESSLTGGDEHRISFRTALETMQADQWLVPTYEGEPRLRKPPLFYWVLTATADLFGPSLFNLRIWGVLCGAILALLAARWGYQVCSADPLLTFVILISSLGLATESRRAMLDIPMTLFLILSLERWGQCLAKGRARDAVVAGFFLAIAGLIKPAALYFFATAMVAMAFFHHRENERTPISKRIIGFALFLISFCALFLPWWAYVQSAYPELLQHRLEEQVERREFSFFKIESIPSLIGGWLGLIAPWSIVLLFSTLHYLRRPAEGLIRPERWLAIWLIIASVPFLFMKTFERYLIPLLPIFAILVSAYLDSVRASALRRHLMVAAILTTIPAIAVGVLVGWFFVPALAAFVLLALILVWRYAWMSDAINTALAVALTWATCLGLLLPSIGIGEGPKLAEEILKSPIYQVSGRHLPLLDVQVGQPVSDLSLDRESLGELPSETSYLIVAESDLKSLQEILSGLPRDSEILHRFGVFRSRKVFTRFSRSDATAEDWRQAVESRSLEGLKKPCVIIEVKPRLK